MNRQNIEKIAHTGEDKVLLAKVWDKIQTGIRKNIMASTAFLSPRELEMTTYLFGNTPGLVSFGGYEEAERRILVYLPDYLENEELMGDDSPICCIHAQFYEGDAPSHRDFLGALMGAGISRESLGDICVGKTSCDFFVKREMADYILGSFVSAGRAKLHLSQIPLSQAQIPEPETREIRDTLASLRLDAVISSGFRLGRSMAASFVAAGKAAVNGLPCEKPDKQVAEGDKISVRGLGKLQLRQVNGETKKGRISVCIDRYV